MIFRRAGACVAGIVLLSGSAVAETDARCTTGDCVYRFDDEGVNSPGRSAYGEWLKSRLRFKRVLLIRPRVSFVPELLKSAGAH